MASALVLVVLVVVRILCEFRRRRRHRSAASALSLTRLVQGVGFDLGHLSLTLCQPFPSIYKQTSLLPLVPLHICFLYVFFLLHPPSRNHAHTFVCLRLRSVQKACPYRTFDTSFPPFRCISSPDHITHAPYLFLCFPRSFFL